MLVGGSNTRGLGLAIQLTVCQGIIILNGKGKALLTKRVLNSTTITSVVSPSASNSTKLHCSAVAAMPLDPYQDPLLNEEEYRLSHELLPRIPCILSILGSSTILYTIVRQRLEGKTLVRPTYQRLIAVLSCVDIVTSFWLALGRVAVPSGPLFGGFGTTQTCTAQGFFTSLGVLATMLYSLALMLQFVLQIRYNVQPRVMATRYEPIFHGVALLFPLAVGITGLVWQVYNPLELEYARAGTDVNELWSYENYQAWMVGNITYEDIGAVAFLCFQNSYPPNCNSGYNPEEDGPLADNNNMTSGYLAGGNKNGLVIYDHVPCTKGNNVRLFMGIYLLNYLACLAIIVACVLTILFTVWVRERSTLRYCRPEERFQRQAAANARESTTSEPSSMIVSARESARSDTNSSNLNASIVSNNNGDGSMSMSLTDRIRSARRKIPIALVPSEQLKMTRMVYVQSLLYGFNYIGTFVWVFSWMVSPQYWTPHVYLSFVGFQGFFSCLIYFYPGWHTKRERQRKLKQRQRRSSHNATRQRSSLWTRIWSYPKSERVVEESIGAHTRRSSVSCSTTHPTSGVLHMGELEEEKTEEPGDIVMLDGSHTSWNQYYQHSHADHIHDHVIIEEEPEDLLNEKTSHHNNFSTPSLPSWRRKETSHTILHSTAHSTTSLASIPDYSSSDKEEEEEVASAYMTCEDEVIAEEEEEANSTADFVNEKDSESTDSRSIEFLDCLD